MPRLTRIRYVNIGHPKARMDDLVLKLCDAEGRPTDSTIWLDNGGGKSTMLNLFYSMIRPSLREFLGGKAEQGIRKLENYVQKDDHSLVVAEWELDGSTGGTDNLFGDRALYVTGVFIERATGPSEMDEDARLKRLFFGFHVLPREPRLSLDGLPIYQASTHGGKERWTLAGFRSQMTALKGAYRAAQVVVEEGQRDWMEHLDAIGIDPDLFNYQIRMNQREGGAADLFKFRDADEFVDFFLAVVSDHELGSGLSRAIATYRDQLKNRKDILIPERDLVEGLVTGFRGLVEIGSRRANLSTRIGRAAANRATLYDHAQARAAVLAIEAQGWREIAQQQRERAARAEWEKNRRAHLRASVMHFDAHRLLEVSKRNHAQAQERESEARRQQTIWTAAIPLCNALRQRRKADDFDAQIRLARSAHEPLLERVRNAATDYAAAILHRVERIDADAESLEAQATIAESRAEALREQALEQGERHAAEKAKSVRITEQLGRAEADRARLERLGALFQGQEPAEARIHWREEHEAKLRGVKAVEARFRELEAAEAELINAARRSEQEEREAAQQAREARSVLTQAESERARLESDERLLEVLEAEPGAINLDELKDLAFAQVRHALESLQSRVYRLWSERAEAERVRHHLDQTYLLPPSREVEQVLEVLRGRLQGAWSGWEYVAESFPNDSGAARAFIARFPHLATGVIVRDVEFSRAEELLCEAGLVLDFPVVVAPQAAAHADGAALGIVLGPTGDAHFDTRAGHNELQKRARAFTELQREVSEHEHTHGELRDLSFRLSDFRARYPQGWFTTKREAVSAAEDWAGQCLQRLQRDSEALSAVNKEKERLRSEEAALKDKAGQAQRFHDLADGHITQYGTDVSKQVSERVEAEKSAAEAARQRDEANENAREAEQLERMLRKKASGGEHEKGGLQTRLAVIQHVDTRGLNPREGDVDLLGSRYEQLYAQYTREVGEDTLSELRRVALAEEESHLTRFRRLLREGVGEEVVRTAVEELSDLDEADERVQRANANHPVALSALGHAKRELDRVQEYVGQANRLKDEYGVLPEFRPGRDGVPEREDQFGDWISHEGKAIEELMKDGELAAREASDADSEADAAEARRRLFESAGERLNAVGLSYASLFNRVNEIPPVSEGWVEPSLESELSERIQQIEQELGIVRKEDEQLNRERDTYHQQTIAWIEEERFAAVVQKHAMVRGIRSRTAELFETDAAELLENLGVRLERIQATLEDIQRHRETLIDHALFAGERGVQLLENVGTRSRLPAQMPRFGGMNFLKISLGTPDQESDRRSRMELLIDAAIDEPEIPSGIKLVQSAVRRLAQPIRVKVLFPDPVRGPEYLPVERLGVNSGGEQLTSAILLYCTLAQLRARQRGVGTAPTSVLILDNPFGTASRVSFLEVQLEVARAAGVQLIYTTGIKDYDAVSTFPNINRLRPSGMDRATGEFLVRQVPVEDGIDVARLYRAAPSAGAAV